jgi:hypothetical protein
MNDKLWHFTSNIASTLSVGIFSPSHGVAFSLGLSGGKEVGDWMNYGQHIGVKKFAPMAGHDMFFNALGIGVGFLIALVLHNLFFGGAD